MEQKAHQPVTTASDLLRSLDGARASRGVSKAELARRSHVRAETVRRLLTDEAANPSLTNVLDMLRPLGLGLGLVELPRPVEPTDDMLCAWLSFYGAALYGSARVDPSTVPDVENSACRFVETESTEGSRRPGAAPRILELAPAAQHGSPAPRG